MWQQANQKRLVDDLERRINPLFDALNCETVSRPVVDQLIVLTRGLWLEMFLKRE
jgi:protein transport protein SEC31